MSNKILQLILVFSSVLVFALFFIYRSFGWPLGRESMEAFIAFGVFIVSACSYSFYLHKQTKRNPFQEHVAIQAGFWTGLCSGAVAGVTALIFIVFGMSQILRDPLNITEWASRGASSGTPNISVYFAYQTLAGAILHLVVLGVMMGVLLGVIGGVIGKSAKAVFRHSP